MNNAINVAAVLSFFSGKSLENATKMMALLEESIAQGFWVKGVSRSVTAAFSGDKANEATKMIKKLEKENGGRFEHESPVNNRAYIVKRSVFQWLLRPDAICGANKESTERELNEVELKVVAAFESYKAAFLPVAEAIKKLDATRPKPVFTTMNASPTVSANLKALGAANVEVCPMIWEEMEITVKGQKVFVPVAKLLWPEGIKHATSRYHSGCQCEACGHGIRNNFNWIPLILTSTDGSKKSLWTGRDCASTLFGVDMGGDLELATGQNPKIA